MSETNPTPPYDPEIVPERFINTPLNELPPSLRARILRHAESNAVPSDQ